jgi:Xaa-Pro dipeptidase
MKISMSDLPQIPLHEYPQRLERLRALMRANGLQAVLLGTGTNLKYFSAYPSPARSGSRPFFLLLPLEGDPIFIVHCGRKAEALRFSWIKDVRDYTELSRVPVQLIRDALSECGARGGKLGMELGFEQFFDVPYLEFRHLQESLPETVIVDAGELLWRLRQVKSEAEVACLRRACQILSDAYTKAFASAREGTPEREIASHLRASFVDEGADDGWILITSGRGNYDLATKPPGRRPIQRGDMVWIDAGCAVGGYWSDFSRAAVVGRPSTEQHTAQETIHQITWETIQNVQPGVRASELAQICNRRLAELSFPITSSISGLASRVGHGVGLDVTEPPHIAEYDQTILEPGMVITIEPGVAAEYGTFHIEENVLVTDEGCEVLSTAPRALWQIAAH